MGGRGGAGRAGGAGGSGSRVREVSRPIIRGRGHSRCRRRGRPGVGARAPTVRRRRGGSRNRFPAFTGHLRKRYAHLIRLRSSLLRWSDGECRCGRQGLSHRCNDPHPCASHRRNQELWRGERWTRLAGTQWPRACGWLRCGSRQVGSRSFVLGRRGTGQRDSVRRHQRIRYAHHRDAGLIVEAGGDLLSDRRSRRSVCCLLWRHVQLARMACGRWNGLDCSGRHRRHMARRLVAERGHVRRRCLRPRACPERAGQVGGGSKRVRLERRISLGRCRRHCDPVLGSRRRRVRCL